MKFFSAQPPATAKMQAALHPRYSRLSGAFLRLIAID
jgi:hypothetical protein